MTTSPEVPRLRTAATHVRARASRRRDAQPTLDRNSCKLQPCTFTTREGRKLPLSERGRAWRHSLHTAWKRTKSPAPCRCRCRRAAHGWCQPPSPTGHTASSLCTGANSELRAGRWSYCPSWTGNGNARARNRFRGSNCPWIGARRFVEGNGGQRVAAGKAERRLERDSDHLRQSRPHKPDPTFGDAQGWTVFHLPSTP